MKNSLHILLFILLPIATVAQTFSTLSKKEDLQKFNGYADFWYSQKEDKIWMQVDKLEQEFLYVHSLTTGIGSNDIGLDRGQLGAGVIVKFQRAGNKLLLVQPNQNYRTTSTNAAESKSIQQAFGLSVLFGFKIEEEKEGSFLIDLTQFLMQDTHGVAKRLKAQKEGNYKLDKSRSALAMDRTKSFPKNAEFEALLTFTGEPTGRNLRTVVPDASAITVIQHHSFVALPDDNYTPREFVPGCGSFPMTFSDYSTPVWEPIKKRLICRHRLEKKTPGIAMSEAKEPIIYYLDPGTPEPVRSALLEGARWWNQAFEAAGYINAFQVKMLPEDADPMDLRYNVIQWVHRSTRGWSYGASVSDPRTGEILKGHVSLGSLRIRQDFMIAQALLNQPFAERDDNYQPMLEMALARIRQLSAHEVGHTLGFAHNFAASANEKASVMDYPHPSFSTNGNEITADNAYAEGIGAWDKVTVAYSYGDPVSRQAEKDYLRQILDQASKAGLDFISDPDARAAGGAHATAHLWDNGKDITTELKEVLKIRQQAIKNFGKDNIRTGEPYTVLEDVFVPLYFFHRYQTEATTKLIGGLDYSYAAKGEEKTIIKNLSKDDQEKALQAVLMTLSPVQLMIPERLLKLFPPRAYGYNRSRESFKSTMGVSFDPLGAAATASDFTLSYLLHPQRSNRLVLQRAVDKNQLGLEEVMKQLNKQIFKASGDSPYEKEIARTIQFSVLKHIMNLARQEQSLPQTKAIAFEALSIIKSSVGTDDAYAKMIQREIDQFLKAPEKFKVIPSPKIPDGSPIGSFSCTNTH
ncbi:zinc-dependent metalloprotease [Gangjinia marincola]|uniref:Zinc-dependent metalloprotease n=1 Tax=Gangjinia marincola TaxID=578463 RepID=A0ABN1MCT0_9FLAO